MVCVGTGWFLCVVLSCTLCMTSHKYVHILVCVSVCKRDGDAPPAVS